MTPLALFGGEPVRANPYPAWPVFDEREIAAVSSVVRSGQWGGFPYPGRQSRAFAQGFADMQGGQLAVLVANGTITIEVALRAAGVGWGDEVILPAYTFQATATAVIAAAAGPVMAG